MDKISKSLRKLTDKERKIVKDLLSKIKIGNFSDLDILKLKGHKNIYRIRRGKLRIIINTKGDKISILAIERRSDKTYNL